MTNRTRILIRLATATVAKASSSCGGVAKPPVVAEGVDPDTGLLVRVCERCLRTGDVERHLAAEGEFVASLRGRLVLPGYDDWQAAVAAHAKADPGRVA